MVVKKLLPLFISKFTREVQLIKAFSPINSMEEGSFTVVKDVQNSNELGLSSFKPLEIEISSRLEQCENAFESIKVRLAGKLISLRETQL
jgi:hypothetical protein